MKKKAALIVCGILAASFVTSAASDHLVMGEAKAAEHSGSRTASGRAQSGAAADSEASTAEEASTDAGEENSAAASASNEEDNEEETASAGRTEQTEASESASTGSGEDSEEETEESGETLADGRTSDDAETTGDTEEADDAETTDDAEDADDAGSSGKASSDTEEDAKEDAEDEDGAGENENAAGSFSDYLTAAVPEDWKDQADIEEETVHGLPAVAYYEKTSHESGEGGGLLVRIGLYTDRDAYLSLPNYAFLGNLRTEDGQLYAVIAEFPSDVQFSTEAADQYAQMETEIPSLLKSLQATDGQTYHAGKTKADQAAEKTYTFASILDQFRTSGMLPNGTMIDTSTASADTNQYAILDVNGDGQDELVLKIGSKAASDKISRAAANAEDAAADEETSADEGTSAEENAEEVTGEENAADEDTEAADGDTTEETEAGEAADEEASDEEVSGETADSEGTEEAGEDTTEESAADESADEETTEEAAADESTDEVTTEETAATDSTEEETAGEDTEDTSEESSTEDSGADVSEDAGEDVDASLLFGGHHAAGSEQDEVQDTIAASNYYVFTGDSETDSHASHLTADSLAEALSDSSEQYTDTAYDIDWNDISQGAVNRLYGRAAAPVGESAEHIDALRRHAYKAVLQDIIENNTLPDGSKVVPYDDFTEEDIAENHFDVRDVDADGFDELLIQITNTDADAARELVYGFDTDKRELVLEFEGVPEGTIYYDDGTLQAQSRYDNNEPSALWPFQLRTYDSETGSYDFKGSVYAWDADLMQRRQTTTVDGLTQSFPTEADTNDNGRVYFLNIPEETDAGEAETDAEAADDSARTAANTSADTDEAAQEETDSAAADIESNEGTDDSAAADIENNEDTDGSVAADTESNEGTESVDVETGSDGDAQNAEGSAAAAAVDDAAILSWYNSIVSANSNPIALMWNTITDDYIRSELTNWQ